MKKIIRLLFAMLLVVVMTFSGCGSFWDLFGNTLVSYDRMEYVHPDMEAFQSALDESLADALALTDIDELVDSIFAFYAVYDDFFTNMNLAFIHYSADLTDIYWEKEYAYCAEQSATAEAGLDALYRNLAKSPLRETLETEEYFGADYFDSYDGESLYDEHFLSLLTQEAQLQSQYQIINGEAAAAEYYSEVYFSQYGSRMAQVFLELVQLRQQIADYAGYDSYVEFAYDFYHVRDYTPEQATAYLADIRAELVPLYRSLDESFYGDLDLNYCSQSQMLGYARSVTKKMGGVISQAFSAMENAGMYDITYSENKYNTSFEVYLPSYATPYVFVCPTGTQYDKLTLVHEFGHFCCDYVNYGGANQSVDVSEIFSQAMEYLSLCYGDNTDALTTLKMADCLSIYIEQAAYACFEHQVYALTDEELTLEGIESLYADVLEAYGMDGEGRDSREYVCVTHFYESPLYVVSYVLSNDVALQIYERERQESGKGLECYVNSMTIAQPYLLAFLEEAGLESPFTPGRLSQVKQTLQQFIRKN